MPRSPSYCRLPESGATLRLMLLEAPWFTSEHAWSQDGSEIVLVGYERPKWPPGFNLGIRLEGYPVGVPPGQDPTLFEAPFERSVSERLPDSRYYLHHPIGETSFYSLSVPGGQLTPLGSVRLRSSIDDLGARALSIDPTTGRIAFTAGGSYGSVWIIEGALARLTGGTDADRER